MIEAIIKPLYMHFKKQYLPVTAAAIFFASGLIAWVATTHPGFTKAVAPSGGYPDPATCSTTAGSYCETWQATQVLGQVFGFAGGPYTIPSVVTVPEQGKYQAKINGQDVSPTVFRVPGYAPTSNTDLNGTIDSQSYYTSGTVSTGSPIVTQWTVTGTVH